MAIHERLDSVELRARLEALHAESFGWALCCSAHDRAEAADVVQTAYWKVLDGRARFDGQSAFKTWLFGVIRHTAQDWRRRAWRHWRRLVPLGNCPEDALPAAEVDGQAVMEQQETLAELTEALVALPRRQREVLHLVFYQELSLSEAAAAMGVTVGAARQHYERGKTRLRMVLKPTQELR